MAPWAVLFVLLLITAAAASYVWDNSQLAERAHFETEVRIALDDVRYRLDTYVNVLRAAGGLFAAAQDVTRDQFRAYVQSLQIQTRHPGIQGIGISLRVRPEIKDAVVNDLRINEFDDFKIWPEHPGDDIHAIVLLEPLDHRNRAAIGFDMSTNPTRRRAMERARDTAEPAASGRVRLVQEIDPTRKQPGFLIYVPVYTTHEIPKTVEERRQALYGFIYAPFRAADLFAGIFGSKRDDFFISIQDGDELFYENARPSADSRYRAASDVNVAGRKWTIRFASRRQVTRQSMLYAGGTAAGGLLISLLVFTLLRVQLHARGRAEETAERLRRSEGELQEASRAKDEFLATLSHELRTPMTSIVGWSNLLAEDLDAETSALAIESIQKSSRAQAQLIEDLLDVSRITAGKMSIDQRPLDLAPIVASAVDSVMPAAEAKGVRVGRDVPAVPILVNGDAGRLQQIIGNLISNAVKFTPEGGSVTLALRLEASQAVIEVNDSGLGIDAAFLPHVFERFRQADSSSTRSYTGLGLGLGIVRTLVELHGGTVSAASDGEGKGARFTVRLPVLVGEHLELGTSSDQDHSVAEKLDGVRILVVDDEEVIRSYAGAVLRRSGAEVRCVGSAADAIATIGQWKPDVIVTDIGMPGRDGYELLLDIRASGDGIAAAPVIALTAHARDEDRERVAQAGFAAFVAKPVDPEVLRRTVAEVLDSKLPGV